MYTPLNTSRERVLKGCANTKFKEAEIKSLYQIREYVHTDWSKYCCFYKSHYHNTDNCIQLKDVIKGLLKKGWMYEYTMDQKRSRNDSPQRKKSLKKVVSRNKGDEPNSREDEEHKGKFQYISFIT